MKALYCVLSARMVGVALFTQSDGSNQGVLTCIRSLGAYNMAPLSPTNCRVRDIRNGESVRHHRPREYRWSNTEKCYTEMAKLKS